MAILRRYQVFVSSTFSDLQQERQEIMQALLELDCIPAGMELFPAANEDQWTLIKRVIDDCDYYLVVIGGRYGSIGPDGYSYTEMEYRYALDQKKPVIGFIHKDPGSLPSSVCESDPEKQLKLDKFRDLIQKKLVKFWTTPADLGSVVSRSVVNLVRDFPATGWVRADNIPDESAAQEILKLKRKIEELESINRSTKSEQFIEGLASGEDIFQADFDLTVRKDGAIARTKAVWKLKTSWNELFSCFAPSLAIEGSEETISEKISEFAKRASEGQLYNDLEQQKMSLFSISISSHSLDTIIIQMAALGLIEKSIKNRGVKNIQAYWKTTNAGERLMYELRAIRKDGTKKADILATIENIV